MDSNFWDLKNKEKICIFDIDGVLLSNYPQCWIDFVNSRLNTNFDDLHIMKNHVTFEKYRQLKEEYRVSGIKATFAPDKYASMVMKKLKQLGYMRVVMTARPVDKYPQLYNLTTDWLRKNKIGCDCIYFGEKNKHAKILSELPHTKFIVEDNSYSANQISKWGYTVFLLTNKYNATQKLEKNVIRINKLNELFEYLI